MPTCCSSNYTTPFRVNYDTPCVPDLFRTYSTTPRKPNNTTKRAHEARKDARVSHSIERRDKQSSKRKGGEVRGGNHQLQFTTPDIRTFRPNLRAERTIDGGPPSSNTRLLYLSSMHPRQSVHPPCSLAFRWVRAWVAMLLRGGFGFSFG